MAVGGSRARRALVAAIASAAAALSVVPAATAASENAYVTTLGSGVFAFDVIEGTGGLQVVQGSPFPAGNDGFGVTATPNRRHLYVSNYGNSTVGIYGIGNGGALSPAGTASTPKPVLSATTPDGRYLYVANDGAPGGVSGFGIDRDTGALAPVPNSPVAATTPAPFGVAISPDGQFAYVTNVGNSPSEPGSVSVFGIDNSTGALTEIAGSPYTLEIAPGGIAMTPDGQRLYIANGESATISGFARNADSGALTPLTNSPFPAGNGEPTGVAITPDGRHLYTAVSSMVTEADNRVAGFSIDQSSGALAAVPGSPYAAGLGPQYLAITGDGAHMYVTNNGSQDMTGYSIDASNGALSPLADSPFFVAMNPLGIAIPHEPSNKFKFGKLRKLKRKGKARLKLELPAPGHVELAGNGVRKRSRDVAEAEPRFNITAQSEKKLKLRAGGKVKVKVKAKFTPDGGSRRVKQKKVRLVRKR